MTIRCRDRVRFGLVVLVVLRGRRRFPGLGMIIVVLAFVSVELFGLMDLVIVESVVGVGFVESVMSVGLVEDRSMVDVVVVVGRFDFLDDGVETLVAGRVLDHASRTVRLQETVRAFDVAVPVARLVLTFHVLRVRVLDAVLETVRTGRRVIVGIVVMMVLVSLLHVLLCQRVSRYHDVSQQSGQRDGLKIDFFFFFSKYTICTIKRDKCWPEGTGKKT